jgi:hypothetical protein
MRITRRRLDRPDSAVWGRAICLEVLEARELLSTHPHGVDPESIGLHPFSVYIPTDLSVQNPITHQPLTLTYQQLVHDENPQSPLLNNQGKVVSGKDRQGNEWTITVHGPGSVIVTDATPNDGSLDDTIDTIQLIGTSLKDTYVTGTVVGSAYTPTNSTVLFNKLIAVSGVKSVILNGFSLTQTVAPPPGSPTYSNTGIFLYGGVGTLEFTNVMATINPTDNPADSPIKIVLGDPNTPQMVKPTIKFDSAFNTVVNPAATTAPPAVPQTNPTVLLNINGEVQNLDFVSTGQQENVLAGFQFLQPIVASTGRTAVQAKGIDNIHVYGSATNFTASRSSQPFQNRTSGLDHLGTAAFNHNADAVGLDVNGPIGKVRFSRGLGNPTGTSPSATDFGIPASNLGYPANGLVGGLVRGSKIGAVRLGPANSIIQTPLNPDFVKNNSTGDLNVYPQPGNAASSAAIVSAGKIGKVAVRGNLSSSEIKSGFDNPSFTAGLEGTRAPSLIRRSAFHGDLVNGDVSATYRPGSALYGSPTSVKGPGILVGNQGLKNSIYYTGSTTPLLNRGTGFYAKIKRGNLPKPSLPNRVESVQVR